MSLRVLKPFAFFFALLAWITAKIAYTFSSAPLDLALLCKWDCGWYESIARQGYLSPIPPLFQNSEESNVAFFPAFPLLGRTLSNAFGIELASALPLAAILCALVVSLALSKLLAGETKTSRLTRYAVLFTYPATFYLFVAYSESLYLAAMLGGIALLLREKRTDLGTALIAASGILLGGTRLTGFVVPSFLVLGAGIFALKNRSVRALGTDPTFGRSIIFLQAALAAAASFFIFCQIQFGVWNLYFKQLALGWYKEFSPLKAFNLFFYPRKSPSLDYWLLQAEPRRLSWIVVVSLTLISFYAIYRAFLTAREAYRLDDRTTFLRCLLVFAAVTHLGIVVCGDVGPWDGWANGMRYSMPTVYLLAIAWQDDWTPSFIRNHSKARYTAYVIASAILAFLYANQVGFLERFIRNLWVS